MALSISVSPPSSTRVGTRRSGLYGAILSASPNVDHGRCANGKPYSRNAIATRRTKGESYWPIRIMGFSQLVAAGPRQRQAQKFNFVRAPASLLLQVVILNVMDDGIKSGSRGRLKKQ